MSNKEACSLEKRKIPHGDDEKPALHETWVTKRVFPRYVPPPFSPAKEFPLGAKESWLELLSSIEKDLYWLLQLPYHRFWSQIIFDEAVMISLTSFLQEAPPAYTETKYPKEIQDAVDKLGQLVFLVFERLATTRESCDEFISPNVLGDILYNKYIFTVPSLLDICLIFGRSNTGGVRKIVETVTEVQPKYLEDLSTAEPHLVKVLENADEMLQEDGKSPHEIKDILLHIYDSLATMRIFCEIFPKACSIYATPDILSALASFYTSTVPELAKKPELKTTINVFRIESVKFVRVLLENILNQAMESLSTADIEKYLALISEIMSEGVFVCDYHALYPIDSDFEIIQAICPDIDTVKLEYLTEALASHVEIKLKKKEEPRPPPNHVVNYPTSGGSSRERQRAIGGVELLSLISQVRDILPHLGEGFVEACLKHYDYSTEQVISAVLESKLPPTLEELDWKLEKPPLPVPDRANVFDYDEFDLRTAAQVDKTRMYMGKKPSEHRNLNQLLSDKREIDEMRDKFAGFGLVEEYEDEYDDTYDDQDVAIKEPDANTGRRQFVTPRVLQTYQPVDEEEEESEEESIKKDHFLQNPEELRAKAEARRAQARGQRDVVGKAKGQGQEKQVLINRDKKNVNKSAVGNHHRRDRASRKRNQGMIPS